MHLLLTDRLTCPRCGPGFGLILLAEAMEDRRVKDGVLGCPNCRDGFPVSEGFGDLRAPPRRELECGYVGAPDDADPEEAERIAALIGVARGPGTIALVGGPAAHGALVARLTEELQVVGLDAGLRAWPDDPDWSRLVSNPGLPFFSRTLRGVAVDGRLGESWITESARVVAPMSRVVVVEAPVETPGWLEQAGLGVMVSEAETVVAARS